MRLVRFRPQSTRRLAITAEKNWPDKSGICLKLREPLQGFIDLENRALAEAEGEQVVE
jgi:hypothetical protein